MMENAEAGPSRQRQLSTSMPDPSADVPATPKSRRRSWFSFGSPSTPNPPAGTHNRSRKSSHAKVEDELEMSPVGPVRPRQSVESAARSDALDGGDALDAGVDNESNSAGKGPPAVETELLTIHGDPECTIKRKKKKRRPSQEEEGEVVRLQDLGSARKLSTTSERKPSQGSPLLAQTSFGSRFPGASDSGAGAPDVPYLERALPVHQPPTGRWVSSSTGVVTTTSSKEQPPIPHERPLPPLPPDRLGTPPEIPRSIVVTPSSPRKASSGDHLASIHAVLPGTPSETRRSGSRSQPGSRATSKTRDGRSPKRSPIGLGLPGQNTPQLLGTDNAQPPRVPAKPHAVSSPFPSRTPSPVPRITFLEPAEPPEHPEEGKKEVLEEKRGRVRRARSLSGIFSKSSTGATVQARTAPQTPDEPHPPTESSTSVTAKSGGGVLEWLGVRKTIKRRQSEARLKDGSATPPTISRAASPVKQSSVGSGPEASVAEQKPIAIKLQSGVADSSSVMDDKTPTPSLRSTSASQPASKLSSLFSRRHASKSKETPESDPSSPLHLHDDTPTSRELTASSSSSSSFVLPAVESVSSPIYPAGGPLSTSPKAEYEEMLFSSASSSWGPGIRPWMDASETNHRSARTSISTALGSLPETSVLQSNLPLPPSQAKEGRIRSWSDAPRPPSTLLTAANASNPHLPVPASEHERSSQSLQPSPLTPSRPLMSSRSNTANSAIISRMKTVFARSSSRQRANTELRRQASGDVDEFGGIHYADEWASNQRTLHPSSSTPSSITSPHSSEGRSPIEEVSKNPLVSREKDPRMPLQSGLERHSRTSMPGSVASRPSSSSDAQREWSGVSRARPRASTISTGPTTQAFAPPSPSLLPRSATPPRRRPSILHRVSNGLMGSRPSSPRQDSLFPLPPRSSGSVSSIMTPGGGGWEDGSSTALSPGTSPRPSFGSFTAVSTPGAIKQAAKRDGDETPEQFLYRVQSIIGRSDIASVIAAKADDFHSEVLRLYMARFDFTLDPLDIALRRLLMHMSLPGETQQIDRVIEAFANRYEECEPGLFSHKDNTYVLAFSMMMLHTDAFNRNNKNKMTKADYVRNTRLDGLPSLVLEAFFDNITFTPFVFIEDDADLTRTRAPEADTPGSELATASSMPPPKSSKLDVYNMIINDHLATLRVDIHQQIPLESPFSCLGSRSNLNIEAMHRAFTAAHVLQVTLPGGRRKSSATALPGKLANSTGRGAPPHEVTLKVTKVGLLSRRDESNESKKSSRKWRSWSLILTNSQLLFFKDPAWALTLLEHSHKARIDRVSGQVLFPRMTTFKPDEVFPLKDCFAVLDRSLSRNPHPHTFRFVMPQGRQYLMQVSDEYEMNEWINLINYASVYKSTGIRMRGSTMDKDQVVLAGAAAAASHRRDVELEKENGSSASASAASSNTVGSRTSAELVTPRKTAVFGNAFATGTTSKKRAQKPRAEDAEGLETLDVGVEEPDALTVDEGDQLEEVFEVVKSELAAHRAEDRNVRKSGLHEAGIDTNGHLLSANAINGSDITNANTHGKAQAARVRAIEAEISRTEERIKSLEDQIAASLRIARNLTILTPFQRSTRDRIAAAIAPLATRIRNDRLQLAKYEMWELVLNQDRQREKRDWARVRHVALQAATKSLDNPLGLKGVVDDVNHARAGEGVQQLVTDKVEVMSENMEEGNEGKVDGNEYADDYANEPSIAQEGLMIQRGSDGGSGTQTPFFGMSPGELPIMIRKMSDDPRLESGPMMNENESRGENTTNAQNDWGEGTLLSPNRIPGAVRRSSSNHLLHDGDDTSSGLGSSIPRPSSSSSASANTPLSPGRSSSAGSKPGKPAPRSSSLIDTKTTPTIRQPSTGGKLSLSSADNKRERSGSSPMIFPLSESEEETSGQVVALTGRGGRKVK